MRVHYLTDLWTLQIKEKLLFQVAVHTDDHLTNYTMFTDFHFLNKNAAQFRGSLEQTLLLQLSQDLVTGS